jgi:hypothetical protein
VEQALFCAFAIHCTCSEVPHILWNVIVYYVHKNTPMVTVVSEMNPACTLKSCHLCLGLLSDLFPLGFTTKILYVFRTLSTRTTRFFPFSSYDLNCVWWIMQITLHEALHYKTFFSLPLLLLCYVQIRYSPSLRFSLGMRAQVRCLYKIVGKVIICIHLIFASIERTYGNKRFWTECWKSFPRFIILLASLWLQFQHILPLLNSGTSVLFVRMC